jgi:hypothetical protein
VWGSNPCQPDFPPRTSGRREQPAEFGGRPLQEGDYRTAARLSGIGSCVFGRRAHSVLHLDQAGGFMSTGSSKDNTSKSPKQPPPTVIQNAKPSDCFAAVAVGRFTSLRRH